MYLDHAGAALPNPKLIEDCANTLLFNSFGNPHSDPKTHDIIEKTRKNVLNFIGLNEDDYTLVFTSGATEAISVTVL
jgi:molybdenum cofactor sulfurtransferase